MQYISIYMLLMDYVHYHLWIKTIKRNIQESLFDRDCAYHMGTTWGFLIGGFITAYCKVNDYSKEAIEKAEHMCRGI